MNPHGRTFRTLSFTCALDGLDHFVSDDGPATKSIGRSGVHTALCGHLIQVVALVSPPVRYVPAARSWLRRLEQRAAGCDRLANIVLAGYDGYLPDADATKA